MVFEVKPGLPVDKPRVSYDFKLVQTLNIAGGDYSAAMSKLNQSKLNQASLSPSKPNATWIACGKLEIAKASGVAPSSSSLGINNVLHIGSIENIGSDRLLDNLLALNKPKPNSSESNTGNCSDWLIGLDFPFSFPKPFTEILMGAKPSYTWSDLAEVVHNLSFEALLAQVTAAKPIMGGEIKRLTDHATDPKAQSPLHQINPGMLKMTWQGMSLLLALQQKGFNILPFATSDCISRLANNSQIEIAPDTVQASVMEVYPAAVLKSLGLPWRKYKGKNPEAVQLRQFILSNLTRKGDKLRSVNKIAIGVPELALAQNLEQIALASDDALDAVVAALGAALAYLNPGQTAPPRQISADLIGLEGWIYVPRP